jgi:hypothetical protein
MWMVIEIKVRLFSLHLQRERFLLTSKLSFKYLYDGQNLVQHGACDPLYETASFD